MCIEFRRTSLSNFVPICLETTELWAFLKILHTIRIRNQKWFNKDATDVHHQQQQEQDE